MFAAMTDEPVRCGWVGSARMCAYHDTEWGVPLHDDRKLFEFLVLEGMQAGLSWSTVLDKRDSFRRAFLGFDPKAVARFDAGKVKSLLADAAIIRNRQKIAAAIGNARAFLALQDEFGSFDAYSWRFVGGRPRVNHRRSLRQMPPRTRESDQMSRDLIARGFKFVGSTIIYSHMQASGMVNDHLVQCFRWSEVQR